MRIGSFPLTRHVLIEKINSKKSLKEGWWRLEFMDFKNDITETFIVDSVSPIHMNVTTIPIPIGIGMIQFVAGRNEWDPVSFRILESEGQENEKGLSKWINAYMFNDGNHPFLAACSIKLSNECGSSWVLHGCIPKSVNDENGLITLELDINHAVLV